MSHKMKDVKIYINGQELTLEEKNQEIINQFKDFKVVDDLESFDLKPHEKALYRSLAFHD